MACKRGCSALLRARPFERPATFESIAHCRRRPIQHRTFSASRSTWQASNPSDLKSTVGPFSWKAATLFIATGTGLYFYFAHEKNKVLQKKRQELEAEKVGRPKIGGAFELIDQDGKPFTDKDLLGHFSLVYFGFTNCPDICPEELDKMSAVVDEMEKEYGPGTVKPVFVTCDPARDSVQAVKTYLKDFHPSMVGLTGSYDAIKATCRTFRVYFSTPPNVKPTEDYLVDHSIFFYLMDPEGKFVDAFGRAFSKEDVTAKTKGYINDWNSGKRW